MMSLKEMTREQYMDLFGLTENDFSMEYAEQQVDEGSSWYEVAKANIATMNYLLTKN